MVLDLHLPEDWDVSADPFRELWWNGQVPILYSMRLLVVKRASIVEKAFATQRSRSESKVVGVGTGASLQEPGSVRFRRRKR